MSDHHHNLFTPEGCVFCEIVAGQSPASVFFEDDLVLGLMTIGPVTTGHAMVIPKGHVPYLAQLDEKVGRWKWTWRSGRRRLFEKQPRPAVRFDVRPSVCTWPTAELHAGDLPRASARLPTDEGDPFSLVADWMIHPLREELDRIASQVKAGYSELWEDLDDRS